MSDARQLAPLPDAVIAALRGEAPRWTDVDMPVDDLFDRCITHEVIGLLHVRLQLGAPPGWPPDFVDRVADRARADAAVELLSARETTSILGRLAAAGVKPILIKGTPLAYSVYPRPSARPRADTDLLVPRDQIEPARAVLAAAGYSATVYCDGELLFRQFEVQKVDGFGVTHAIDVHWNISTQTLFANVLSYDELAADARPVLALGPAARMPAPVHALLLACIHPVMHHQNEHRLLWVYDVHAIASTLDGAGWDALARLAVEKQVAAIVARGLEEARAIWATPVSDTVSRRLLESTSEASACYLAPGRGWWDEFISNLSHLPSWRSRVQLLLEVAFPSRTYMSRAYGVNGPVGTALLPALYVHRLAAGARKLLLGRK